MHLYLNFSLFYYIAIRKNVTGLTNPEIFSILTDQDPAVSQYPGSSCSFFFNGKRDIPKPIRARMKKLSPEQLSAILTRLHVRNVSQTANIFYGLLKNGIIPVQEYPKQILLEQLTSEKDHMKCLSLIYREVLLDASPKLQLTGELRTSIDKYIDIFRTHDRLRAYIINSEHFSADAGRKNYIQTSTHTADAEVHTTDAYSASPASFANIIPKEKSEKMIPYREIFKKASDALSERINCVTLPDGQKAYGWFRNLELRDRISAFATADGICIAGLTFCTNPEYVLHRQQMLDHIMTYRDKSGGFANNDQRFPAYEATAAIAEAFFIERDFTHFRIVYDDLIVMWRNRGASSYRDGLSSVYLATMLLVLLKGKCPEDVLQSIEKYMTDQAIHDPVTGEILYWNPPGIPYVKGSCAHTGPAVLSLLQLGRYRGMYDEYREKLKRPIEWLLASEWKDMTEITYREAIVDGQLLDDMSSFDHFPPPWCIRALLAAGVPKDHPRLVREIQKLVVSQHNGLWYFNVSMTPQIWMTHEVVQCLLDYHNA